MASKIIYHYTIYRDEYCGQRDSYRRNQQFRLVRLVDVINAVITTTLKYPNAVGETQIVEPHHGRLESGESTTNNRVPIVAVETVPISLNSF